MKKLALLAIGMGLAVSSFAQGYFNFNNASGGSAAGVFIGNTGVAGEGAQGAFVGSDYSVSYVFAVGTFNDQASFQAAGPLAAPAGSATTFFGATGGSPDVDGAGLYDGGSVPITSPATADATMITVQVLAWYNPSGTLSYADAVAQGFNNGASALTSVRLAAGADTTVADLSNVAGFAVNAPVSVPEPATFALAGLGAAAMLIFRRRK